MPARGRLRIRRRPSPSPATGPATCRAATQRSRSSTGCGRPPRRDGQPAGDPHAPAPRGAAPLLDRDARAAIPRTAGCSCSRTASAWTTGTGTPRSHDHGAALARALGYIPVYLGTIPAAHRHNGRELAALLERLVEEWPVPVSELVLLGHSMGGLVARSACHYAEQAEHSWLRHAEKSSSWVRPHHGAPLERAGHEFDVSSTPSHSRPLSPAWADPQCRHERPPLRPPSATAGAAPTPEMHVPLPEGTSCFVIAATKEQAPGRPNLDAHRRRARAREQRARSAPGPRAVAADPRRAAARLPRPGPLRPAQQSRRLRPPPRLAGRPTSPAARRATLPPRMQVLLSLRSPSAPSCLSVSRPPCSSSAQRHAGARAGVPLQAADDGPDPGAGPRDPVAPLLVLPEPPSCSGSSSR